MHCPSVPRHLSKDSRGPHGPGLIDEFQNSLGFNCLADLSTAIFTERTDLQFIVTSHHPYILNAISREHWRLVTRQGSTVRIQDVCEIPELNTGSLQDAFTLLLRYYQRHETIQ